MGQKSQQRGRSNGSNKRPHKPVIIIIIICIGLEVAPPQVSECPPLSLHAWHEWLFPVFASMVLLCVFVCGVVAMEGPLDGDDFVL